jgi:hypothetical protein
VTECPAQKLIRAALDATSHFESMELDEFTHARLSNTVAWFLAWRKKAAEFMEIQNGR